MKPTYLSPLPVSADRIQPHGDLVLVQRLPDAEAQGSILLPERARNPESGLRRGIVMACGPGDRLPSGERAAMHVAVGDEVVYTRVPANDVVIDGGEYTLLHEEQHILAVLS